MSFGATATLIRGLESVVDDHERRPPGADRADLLARVRVLRSEADVLNLPQLAGVAALREGELLLAAGDARSALAVLVDAEPRLSPDLQAVALARSSEALVAMKEMRAALNVCARGIELVERDRDKTSAAYMQGAYLRRTISLYANGIRAAHELGDARVLTWMELSKGRTLPPVEGVPDGMRERLTELGERIDRCRDPEAAVALRLKRRALFDRMLGIQRRPRETFDLAAVQATLEPGQRAISYYWLDRTQLLTAVIDEHEVVTEVRAADVEALAAAVGDEQVPTTLLDRLLEPIAHGLLPDAIRGTQRLLVAPHRRLHTVPFLALPFDGRALIRSMAVATIPNLTCLQAPPPPAPSRRALAVGVNEYAAARPLPHAEEAAAEIAALYGAECLRSPTEHALRAHLTTAPAVLHLTLHGASVESDTPLESFLLLGDSRLDGLDLIDWRLAGTTVVLASCSSGQRAIAGRGMPELPGDDVFGLQAAFFAAGARQLLSALWPVEFRVARAVTRGFHEQLIAGGPADVALQTAVTDYLDNARVLDRDTTYWAPFTLTSNGRLA